MGLSVGMLHRDLTEPEPQGRILSLVKWWWRGGNLRTPPFFLCLLALNALTSYLKILYSSIPTVIDLNHKPKYSPPVLLLVNQSLKDVIPKSGLLDSTRYIYTQEGNTELDRETGKDRDMETEN